MMIRRFDEESRASRSRALSCPTGLLLATAFAFLLAGCGGEEGAGDDLDKQVVSLETEVPLKGPAYQPTTGAVLALTEDGDGIVKLEVEEP